MNRARVRELLDRIERNAAELRRELALDEDAPPAPKSAARPVTELDRQRARANLRKRGINV